MNKPKKEALIYNKTMKWYYLLREHLENPVPTYKFNNGKPRLMPKERYDFETELQNIIDNPHLHVMMVWNE